MLCHKRWDRKIADFMHISYITIDVGFGIKFKPFKCTESLYEKYVLNLN